MNNKLLLKVQCRIYAINPSPTSPVRVGPGGGGVLEVELIKIKGG